MVRFIIPKLYQIIRFVLCGASGVCRVSLCRTIYYRCSLPMLLYTFRSPPHKKHGRKNLREFFFDRSFGKQSCPSDCASPARSGFTTFCHQKVVPKVSARRKAAGNSQRLAKTGACRGFASKPAPFFNARRCSFLFPHFSQGGDCCALRATMIYYDLTSSILSFSRLPACGIALRK